MELSEKSLFNQKTHVFIRDVQGEDGKERGGPVKGKRKFFKVGY